MDQRACYTAKISFPENYCLLMVSLTPCKLRVLIQV